MGDRTRRSEAVEPESLLTGLKAQRDMNHKAQAAMEFLLTYGWAIVVVVTGMGVWGYYFDFYPVKNGMAFRPETCTLEIGLSCLDHSVSYVEDPFDPEAPGTNTLKLRIKNNLGADIEVTNILISEYGLNEGTDWITRVPFSNSEGLESNKLIELPGMTGVNPGLERKSKYDISFQLVVERQDTGLVHYYNGEIVGMVD